MRQSGVGKHSTRLHTLSHVRRPHRGIATTCRAAARSRSRGQPGYRAAREAPAESRCHRCHLPRHHTRRAVRAAEDKTRKPHYCNSCCQLRKPAGLFLSLAFLPLSHPRLSPVQSHLHLSYISHPGFGCGVATRVHARWQSCPGSRPRSAHCLPPDILTEDLLVPAVRAAHARAPCARRWQSPTVSPSPSTSSCPVSSSPT